MEQDFKNHIRSKKLLDADANYLLAISGGMDSVCLAYLLKNSGFKFDMAHVNYGLRADESDGDEVFVRNLAKTMEVKLYVTKPEPEILNPHQVSIQMAAREFRYRWFDEILTEHQYKGVIVAHHADDQVETFFLNLTRGTGAEGLTGMAEINGKIIRPLLSFSKDTLKSYMISHEYKWRNDSSNEKEDYKRNLIRHKLVPVLENDFPGSKDTILQNMSRLKDTLKAFMALHSLWLRENLVIEGEYQYLPFLKVKNLPGRSSMLFYWLKSYGFNERQISDVVQAVDNEATGKTFFSGSYMVNLDRGNLILGKNDFSYKPSKIETHTIEVQIPSGKFDILRLPGDVDLDKSPANAMLDADKLQFPLLLRRWELGDKIVPLGMNHEKKISDLLIDLKVPLIKKKQAMVLCSGQEVAWLLGYRISDRFKCSKDTKNIIYFKQIN